jgi:hypothetical protein
MKITLLPCAALMICGIAPAYALNASVDGGSGLVVMRTADTLPRGSVDISTMTWADAVGGDADRDWSLQVTPGIDFGLLNDLEVGVSAPYMYNINETGHGLRFVRGQVKFRFFNLTEQGISAAVTAYGGAPVSDSERVVSGSNNLGGELNLSMPRLLKPLGVFHASLGFEKSDTKLPPDPDRYERQIKKRLNMGVEIPLGDRISASIEVSIVRAANVNDTVTVIPGLRYAVSDRLILIAGGAWGTPTELAQPEWRMVGGVSYLLRTPWSPTSANASAAGAPAGKPR